MRAQGAASVEKVWAHPSQVTPPEAGAAQLHHDRLTHHDVHAVAAVGPVYADEVATRVADRH